MVGQEPPLSDQIALIVQFRVKSGPDEFCGTARDKTWLTAWSKRVSVPPAQANQVLADVLQKVDTTPAGDRRLYFSSAQRKQLEQHQRCGHA